MLTAVNDAGESVPSEAITFTTLAARDLQKNGKEMITKADVTDGIQQQ